MTLPQAIAAPRASQRNTPDASAEPAFIDLVRHPPTRYGHSLVPAGDRFTSAAEIGAATAVEFGRHGRPTAVSEPTRRGGGRPCVVPGPVATGAAARPQATAPRPQGAGRRLGDAEQEDRRVAARASTTPRCGRTRRPA